MKMETSSLIEDTTNYNQNRSKIKNGLFMSMTIFFKTAFGLGLISNQMYYFQTGYILGILITFLISFIITYSMTLINDISYSIEMNNPGLILENYEQLSPYVFKSKFWKQFMYLSKPPKINLTLSEQDLQLSPGILHHPGQCGQPVQIPANETDGIF
jgi:hypothetical protein